MLRLTRNVIGGLDDRCDVVGRVAGISRIGPIGNPDHVRTGVAEPGNESLDVGDQQIVDAIKAILGRLALALVSEQFAQPQAVAA